MITSQMELLAVSRVSALEPVVSRLEHCLADMAGAMGRQDAQGIEHCAALLQRTLSQAVTDFQHASRNGGVPPELRRRLILAAGQVAAQREALARATASMDRAIEVLLPGSHHTAVYGAQGVPLRNSGYGLSA